mmetsp:Transcript_10401/g.24413  ORF Transcript_10401/g.24413 Transcript_10401/m.24413 type:complete len:183 (+) Transcript_10401:256-804(+)
MLKLMGNSKDIRVKFVHSQVEDAAEEIASMRPWSISWSNVLDYMGPKTFHKLARKLSVHGDVIHFGYSMNWPSAVKGAHLVDYMLCKGNTELAETRAKFIQTSNEMDAHVVTSFGLDGVLRTPPPENPMNTVDALLTRVHYKAWINWSSSGNMGMITRSISCCTTSSETSLSGKGLLILEVK